MGKELVDIVNENDEVISSDFKENKTAKGFVSRNVGIFIADAGGKLIIAKRSPLKKTSPGRFDLAACGGVRAGESYEQAAVRETEEELGISCDLVFLGKLFNCFEENNSETRYFTGIFFGTYSGEIKLGDELVELKRLSLREIEEQLEKKPQAFCPGFINDFAFAKERLRALVE